MGGLKHSIYGRHPNIMSGSNDMAEPSSIIGKAGIFIS